MLGAAGCGMDHIKCLSLIIKDGIFICHKHKVMLKKSHTEEAVRCDACRDDAGRLLDGRRASHKKRNS